MKGINPRMHLVPDLHNVQKVPSRDGYGLGLAELGKTNENVIALCCDLTDSTRTSWFSDKFPDRYFQVGVAEQNMMGIGAGLATLGKIPFVSSYAVFSPGRNWDQVRVSVCYSNLNVKIQGAHAGISVGPDGATHQALEDVASLRCLPNMVVLVPADAVQGEKATIAAGNRIGPVYVRFGREKVPVLTTKETPFEIGKADIYKEGEDVAIVAMGIMVHEALMAAEELEKEGIDAMVINCHTVKPIDVKTLADAARKTGAIVTAEEHQVYGGLGGAVAEALSTTHPVPMRDVAVMDRFGESGKPDDLFKKFGLTRHDIIKAAKEAIAAKKKR